MTRFEVTRTEKHLCSIRDVYLQVGLDTKIEDFETCVGFNVGSVGNCVGKCWLSPIQKYEEKYQHAGSPKAQESKISVVVGQMCSVIDRCLNVNVKDEIWKLKEIFCIVDMMNWIGLRQNENC